MVTSMQETDRAPVVRGASDARSRRWVILLAGGEGERMRPFIEERLGCHRPKQYCAFTGTRTMLDHTHARATALVNSQHVVTIIDQGHDAYLPPDHRVRDGIVIKQPGNRGTAPGILLPLCHVLESDPDATVLILPSDHFVYPEHRFLAQANRAYEVAEEHPDNIVLMGALPDNAETDYGWLVTKREAFENPFEDQGATPIRLDRFHEKPSAAKAASLYREGALWNTFILAAKAETLWRLGRECVPRLMNELRWFRGVLRAERHGRLRMNVVNDAMRHMYLHLERVDFSKSVLERAAKQILALPLRGVQWNDWGRPERIRETIVRIGAVPNFSNEEVKSRADDSLEEAHEPAKAFVAHATAE